MFAIMVFGTGRCRAWGGGGSHDWVPGVAMHILAVLVDVKTGSLRRPADVHCWKGCRVSYFGVSEMSHLCSSCRSYLDGEDDDDNVRRRH